jgi:mRNA interferase MazF
VKRGEVWWADLGLPRGSAPALKRPVVIVGADSYNRSELHTVTVSIITTNMQLAALPGKCRGARRHRRARDQFGRERHADRDDRPLRVEDRIGALPDWLMTQIDAGLACAIGLTLTRR